MPTYSITRPSKIYPNLDFWFENKTSGNPVTHYNSSASHNFKNSSHNLRRLKIGLKLSIGQVGMTWKNCFPAVFILTRDRCYVFIFSQKNSAKQLAFLTQNEAKLCENLIITLVFEKNAIFFAENCQNHRKLWS
jgi:hypothetical protein